MQPFCAENNKYEINKPVKSVIEMNREPSKRGFSVAYNGEANNKGQYSWPIVTGQYRWVYWLPVPATNIIN